MKSSFQNVIKFIYEFLEQFVFYIAAIVAFLCWVSLGNIYIAISIFLLICILFWAIPSIFKKKK
jgi:hypothetical protein